ncbi:MAG: asparagine synthase (glutamine-hydrolyzing) [Planctomycetes bacterium]|nr:asparagine synthase (glutamine-hydrolyzing) [Planctomycetota bacterium]
MCGIVGVMRFSDDAPPIDPARLAAMRDAMTHRGPDGAGLWISDNNRVGLAHRRLAILDLSPAASQPMANEDGSIQIVYNGEIYNHAEVRAELQRIGGHRWRTDHADTEVILHAYEQWGEACVEKFRGMFAFALWDGRRRRLWLVRDRIGVKPLYYTLQSNRLIFASEIKAILADPTIPRRVDEAALFHYLSFLTTPAPATLFAGIRKLAPGTWLSIDADGRTGERRYWDVLDHANPLREDDETLARRLIDELRTSVKLRKLADVPTGVFLSGGIDSSTNAALFAEGGGAVRTFSIGYEDGFESCADELPQAAAFARHMGAEHHERRLGLDDLLSFSQRMAWHQDEPLADPVCVPVYFVSEMARHAGVTVCQAGEGADELFCGYPFWAKLRRLQQRSDTPGSAPFKHLAKFGLGLMGRGDGLASEFLRRGIAQRPIFWSGAEGFTHAQKQRLLTPDLRGRLAGMDSWDAIAPIRRRFEEAAWSRDTLSWMTYADLRLRLPELLLMRIDKMSMAAGVEGRVPFLDHKFVELAMSIPPEARTRNGELKGILRRAVRGVIPDEILQRPKRGFGVPIREWYRGKLGDVIRDEVTQFNRDVPLFEPAALAAVLADPSRAVQSWQLYNLALWWRAHGVT